GRGGSGATRVGDAVRPKKRHQWREGHLSPGDRQEDFARVWPAEARYFHQEEARTSEVGVGDSEGGCGVRLHMVQVSLLGSQWRAFRGNKWNPLKLRVDSLHSRPSPIHHPTRGPCTSPRGNIIGEGQPLRSAARRAASIDDSTNPNSQFPRAPPQTEISSPAPQAQQSNTRCSSIIRLGKSFTSDLRTSARSIRSTIRNEHNSSSDNQPMLSTESESSHINIQQSPTRGDSTTSTGAVTRGNPQYFIEGGYEESRAPLSRVLSAIIFTLVVFLLPTTTVYYVVFLSLRLLLLVTRELLRFIPWLIHHNPVFAPCVLLCHPRALAGEVEFQAVPGDEAVITRGPVVLRVGARTSALSTVVCHFAASHSLPALTLPSLSCIASSVLWASDLL
ncbi:N-acetylglucosaminyl transferase component, partial [Trinorchestia longiramus]